MTDPAELRALADTIEENRIIPERATHVALLRSAADHIKELEKALEQAKREENEACAKIADDYDGEGMVCGEKIYGQLGDADQTRRDITDAIRSRYPAQTHQGEKDETK